MIDNSPVAFPSKASQLSKIKSFVGLYTSRLTAEFRLLLPFLFFLILVTNFATSKTNFETNKDKIMDDPSHIPTRLFLASELLDHNQLDEAENEFKLARNNEGLTQIIKIKSQPEEIKSQIIFWQKITQGFPNYRDAYLKLAILNYKLGRGFDSKKFLDKALQTDPNNEDAKKLSSLP